MRGRLLTEHRQTDGRQVWAGASSGVCSKLRLGGRLPHMCYKGILIHLLEDFKIKMFHLNVKK